MNTMRAGLQRLGFVITDEGNTNINGYDFSWLSAENGNIFVHVTVLYTGSAYVCVSAGNQYRDVLSIRIQSDGSAASLASDIQCDANGSIEHVAPLAGTVYALFYPNDDLCGDPDADVNKMARQSFEEILASRDTIVGNVNYKGDPNQFPVEFYWACGNIFKPDRFHPVNSIITMPRGVAYASIMDMGLDVK
jgi:hypothetical protein